MDILRMYVSHMLNLSSQQVVEKGILPFSKHEKQKAWFLLFSQNQWLGSLWFCRNVHVSIQAVEIR
jgi:hypothetical protein